MAGTTADCTRAQGKDDILKSLLEIFIQTKYEVCTVSQSDMKFDLQNQIRRPYCTVYVHCTVSQPKANLLIKTNTISLMQTFNDIIIQFKGKHFLFQTKDDIFSNLRQSYLQIKEYICIKTKKKCIFQRRPFFAHTKFANI